MSFFSKISPSLSSSSSGQQIICLEITHSNLRAVWLSIDGGSVGFIKSVSAPPPSMRHDEESVKKFVSGLNIGSNDKIILIGSQEYVLSFPAWVSIPREDPKAVIQEGELESSISQAVWQGLNKFQSSASSSFGLPESDILLANIRIFGSKVNHHKVLNPLGFKGKSIEFLTEETFINRSLYMAVKESIPENSSIVFVAQLGLVEVETFFRAGNFSADGEVVILSEFSATKLSLVSRPKYEDGLSGPAVFVASSSSWNLSRLIGRLSDEFLVSTKVAEDIYDLYCRQEISRPMLTFINGILLSEWEDCFKELFPSLKSPSSKRRRQSVYLMSNFQIPSALINKSPVSLDLVSFSSLVAKVGITILPGNEVLSERYLSSLSAFVEFYSTGEEDDLSKLARRRAKWLIP